MHFGAAALGNFPCVYKARGDDYLTYDKSDE